MPRFFENSDNKRIPTQQKIFISINVMPVELEKEYQFSNCLFLPKINQHLTLQEFNKNFDYKQLIQVLNTASGNHELTVGETHHDALKIMALHKTIYHGSFDTYKAIVEVIIPKDWIVQKKMPIELDGCRILRHQSQFTINNIVSITPLSYFDYPKLAYPYSQTIKDSDIWLFRCSDKEQLSKELLTVHNPYLNLLYLNLEDTHVKDTHVKDNNDNHSQSNWCRII